MKKLLLSTGLLITALAMTSFHTSDHRTNMKRVSKTAGDSPAS
jgi:hypothetical protein